MSKQEHQIKKTVCHYCLFDPEKVQSMASVFRWDVLLEKSLFKVANKRSLEYILFHLVYYNKKYF